MTSNTKSENCENRNDPDLVQAFRKKWWVESDFKAPNLPLSLRFSQFSGCWLILTSYVGNVANVIKKLNLALKGLNVCRWRNSLCRRRDFLEVGVQIWQPFVSYLYLFFRVRVDTDFNKAKIRKNLKHKYF